MLDPNIIAQAGASGEVAVKDVEELRKALEAGYGTDVAALTGGGALRVQSLDTTMQAVIQENADFRLFNRLTKTKPTATVDEWTEQSGIGGFLGDSTNSETGVISEASGSYARRTGMVKYLMTRRSVSFVQSLQNTIADSEAVEYNNGALQLLTSAEYLLFEGDDSVVPTEYSGIYAQIKAGIAAGVVDDGNIINQDAQPLNSVVGINAAAANIRRYGNFGKLTDMYIPPLVQSDLDSSLDPAFRVSLDNSPNSIMLGTPVTGIRATGGNIGISEDIFIREEGLQAPFDVRHPTIAVANVAIKPASITGVAAADASSKFSTGRDGNYYYAVAGVTAAGQSAVTVSAQIAVAVGEKVTLTITKSAGGAETGYVLYRSKKNGSNDPADMREFMRVAKGGNTTVVVDLNREIPGTSKAYLLDLRPGQTAITWRQFLPMLRFNLYPTTQAIIPWAQMLFGYLRISKRRHHAVIKNILPSASLWRPFD